MRFWPEGDELIPVKVTSSSRLVRLPVTTRSVINAFFEANPQALPNLRTEIARLSSEEGNEADLSSYPLLVPELFHDQYRIQFYRSLSDQQLEDAHFIVFDMLHLTHPEFYPVAMPFHIVCKYSHMLRRVSRVAFISESVRRTYYDRLLRSTGSGPVLRLGSDGLGDKCNGAVPNPGSLHFSMIGTIEPRKRHSLALDAFESLFPSHPNLSLTVVGRMGALMAQPHGGFTLYRSKCRSSFDSLRTFMIASFGPCSRRVAPRYFSALPKISGTRQSRACLPAFQLLLRKVFQAWRRLVNAAFASWTEM